MPGFDRTGPNGNGPMTGGGFGDCAGATRLARCGRGRGAGRRAGFGRGINLDRRSETNRMGRGYAIISDDIAASEPYENELISEINSLKSKIDALEKKLNRAD